MCLEDVPFHDMIAGLPRPWFCDRQRMGQTTCKWKDLAAHVSLPVSTAVQLNVKPTWYQESTHRAIGTTDSLPFATYGFTNA